MTPGEQEHADLLRLGRLDCAAQVLAELAERERAAPGSVDDLAAQALHAPVTSWARLLRLDVRA